MTSSPDFIEEQRDLYLQSLANDQAYAKAENLGLEIIHPDQYTITLDFDAPEVPAEFHARLEIFKEQYDVEEVTFTTSNSGNRHVYIKTKQAFSPLEQVALQAIFGSDPKRELFGFIRFHKNIGTPNIMFEKPGEKRRLLYGNDPELF